jgi:sporulation related protein
MADSDYTGHVYTQYMGEEDVQPVVEQTVEPSAGNAAFLTKAVNVLGAVASMALIAGVGVWGYKLIVRDVSGVPVVRALEGPMRVQPDDPGGKQADNQGLSVNAVAAYGAASPTADRLVLAPRPIDLTDEDKAATPAEAVATEGSIETAVSNGSLEATAVNALVDQLTAAAVPVSGEVNPVAPGNEAAPHNAGPETTASATEAPETPAPVNQEANFDAPDLVEPAAQAAALTRVGMDRSLRPQARPARLVVSGGTPGTDTVLSSAINAAVDTVARVEVDPDSLAVGTRLAQLGAYDSVEIARSEWNRLSAKFEEYMQDKQRVIQKASSGGRTFYRLRAVGFADLSDARRFCSALTSENTDCIPVTIR